MQNPQQAGKVALITQSNSPNGNGFYADMRGVWWLIVAVLLISALVWLPFVRAFTKRLRTMQAMAGRLAKGDFSARAEDKRTDELADLGYSVNHMADQIGTLVDGQKRLLGDIAHELSSPIARMQAIVGILESPVGDGGRKVHYIDRLDTELQHMGKLVQELLALSKASLRKSVELRPTVLRQQVESIVAREKQNGEQVEVDVPADLVVLSDPELLARAVGNVLRNAVRYAGHCGPIQISARKEQDRARLTISDRGPGVPEEAVPRLFDAFYRPDASRCRDTGGSGLGLAIVKSCVEAMGGTVGVQNLSGGGFEVIIQCQLC